MKPDHQKLVEYLRSQHRLHNILDWGLNAPHFGGTSPHRFDAKLQDFIDTHSHEPVCRYCLKPISFNEPLKIEDIIQ